MTVASLSVQMCEYEDTAARALPPEGPVDDQVSTSDHADMQVRPTHVLGRHHCIYYLLPSVASFAR